MKLVYGIWTEDLGNWASAGGAPAVYATRDSAEKALNLHLSAQGVEYWLEEGLASVYEIVLRD